MDNFKKIIMNPLLLIALIFINHSICWKPVIPNTPGSSISYLKTVNEPSSLTYFGKLPAPTRLISHSSILKSPPPYADVSSLSSSLHQPEANVLLPVGMLAPSGEGDDCGNYKVGFTQDLYFQYIQYKLEMPAEMKEFTLCMWSKFTNHTNDHPLFSYAVDGSPRAIFAWISNTDRSSYFGLAVAGHTFFRLNYPLRLNKWYHMCNSWNGNTGEWQLWVNAERVGRGFHNRLVGHEIPSGGIAITGQEQRQPGGGFLEGHEAPKGSGGLLGEVTMVQLYNVALSAGKAHRNHKHHHAHKFHHEGVATTTQPPPVTTSPPQDFMHPFLTAGQITPMLNLNFAGGQPVEQSQQLDNTINPQMYNTQLLNGQLLSQLVQQELAKQAPLTNSGLVHPQLVNPANVKYIDTTQDHQILFKRESDKAPKNNTRVKRMNVEVDNNKNKTHTKRGLVLLDGSLYDDGHDSGILMSDGSMFLQGLSSIGVKPQKQMTDSDREPASAEVRSVMGLCGGCDEEPFEKALVFGWKSVHKKLYSGAFYIPAVPQCGAF